MRVQVRNPVVYLDTTLKRWAAIITSAAIILGAVGWFTDAAGWTPVTIRQFQVMVVDVADNTRDRRVREFTQLDQERNIAGLTRKNHERWCYLGKAQLKWMNTCPYKPKRN
jgi:hypothetical protein